MNDAWQKIKQSTTPLKDRDEEGTANTDSPPKPKTKSISHTPALKATLKNPLANSGAKSETKPIAVKPINLKSDKPRDIAESDRKRIMAGEITLADRLDLHGFTAHEAEERFTQFIQTCHQKQLGHVLVITGKGEVLRPQFAKWLGRKRVADKIVAFCPATAKHGGGGAWYIKIRRIRTSLAKAR